MVHNLQSLLILVLENNFNSYNHTYRALFLKCGHLAIIWANFYLTNFQKSAVAIHDCGADLPLANKIDNSHIKWKNISARSSTSCLHDHGNPSRTIFIDLLVVLSKFRFRKTTFGNVTKKWRPPWCNLAVLSPTYGTHWIVETSGQGQNNWRHNQHRSYHHHHNQYRSYLYPIIPFWQHNRHRQFFHHHHHHVYIFLHVRGHARACVVVHRSRQTNNWQQQWQRWRHDEYAFRIL